MGRISFALAMVLMMQGCASGSARTEAVSPSRGMESSAARSDLQAARSNETETTEAPKSAQGQDSTDDSPGQIQTLVAALPMTCSTGKGCIPPKQFARAACQGRYPSMAIAMFEKHTPWQRLYLKAVTLEAVNAYGDRSTSAPMVFGEEVLVLRGISQPSAGKLQISSSDIDVLRWDGTCATVARELFSTTRMPNVLQASIDWRYLEDPFQEALLSSKYVAMAYERHRSACRVSSASGTNSQCQRATDKLNVAIGVAVRGGLALPTPVKLPKWATPDQVGPQDPLAMFRTKPR